MSFICINLWHFMSPTLFSYAKLPGFFSITMHWSIAQQTTQDTTLSMQLRHEENLHPCPVLSNRYDAWMACHDSHDPYRSLSGADLGGGCRGCAPPPEMKLSSSCIRIWFFFFLPHRQWCHSLEVHPLLRKILDPPLMQATATRKCGLAS